MEHKDAGEMETFLEGITDLFETTSFSTELKQACRGKDWGAVRWSTRQYFPEDNQRKFHGEAWKRKEQECLSELSPCRSTTFEAI